MKLVHGSLVLLLVLAGVVRGQAPAPMAEAPTPIPQFPSTPLRIPETMQRVTAVAFSPNGKYLASAHGSYDRSGSLQVWEMKSGKRAVIQVFPHGVASVGWV